MEKKEYIEREAFLEQKREQYCKDCARRKGMRNGKYKTLYEIGEAPCRACGIDDVLNDVEDFPAADVQPVEWIPVTERLPGMYVPCLLYNSSQPTMVGWRIDEKRFRIPGSFLPDHPTHWMPLPTPPKEETT